GGRLPHEQRRRATNSSPFLCRNGSALASGGRSLGEHPVQEQQEQSAEQRGNEAGGVALAVNAEHRTEEPSHERAGNAEQDRDDHATGVLAGHDELGECADDEADDQGPEQIHISSRRVWDSWNRGPPCGTAASPTMPPFRRFVNPPGCFQSPMATPPGPPPTFLIPERS